MKEPRVNVNRLREKVIQAAYAWRSAEVQHACCILGVRHGCELSDAATKVRCAESDLQIKIDILHKEEKSLGLI
jgi:hypothetical protein